MDKVGTSVVGSVALRSDDNKPNRSKSPRPQQPQGPRVPTSHEAPSLTEAATVDMPPPLAKTAYRRLQNVDDVPPVRYCRDTVSDRRDPGLSITGKLLHKDAALGSLSLLVVEDELAVAHTMRHSGIESNGDGVWTVFFNLNHVRVNDPQDTKSDPQNTTPDSPNEMSQEITRMSSESGQRPPPEDTSKCCIVS